MLRERGERDAEAWVRNAREQTEQSVKAAEQTRLALLLSPATSGSPTKPSAPVRPTSTILPFVSTVRMDASPLRMK